MGTGQNVILIPRRRRSRPANLLVRTVTLKKIFPNESSSPSPIRTRGIDPLMPPAHREGEIRVKKSLRYSTSPRVTKSRWKTVSEPIHIEAGFEKGACRKGPGKFTPLWRIKRKKKALQPVHGENESALIFC